MVLQAESRATHMTGVLCKRVFRIPLHPLKRQFMDEFSNVYSPNDSKREKLFHWM